jgi:hypothetical protein
MYIKGKLYHYRPGQPLRIQGGWGSQISRQLSHEGSKVVSPMHWPPLSPQEIFLVLTSFRGWVDPRATVWPEGLRQWKIPMTPSGIEPMTYRLIAQCLNQLRHHVPPYIKETIKFKCPAPWPKGNNLKIHNTLYQESMNICGYLTVTSENIQI